MDWKALYQTLDGLFDTKTCLEITETIWENDRWCSFDKNTLTAEYCTEILRQVGLSQVEMLPLRADGHTKYLDWNLPKAWDAKSATLRYADGELICDYLQKPCCLATFSPATPVDGVEAEVVIPDKTDSNPEKYRGKVLLVSDPVADWTDFAQTCGADGLPCTELPFLF